VSYSESTAGPSGNAEQHTSNALSGDSISVSGSTVVEISITDNCRASLGVLALTYSRGVACPADQVRVRDRQTDRPSSVNIFLLEKQASH